MDYCGKHEIRIPEDISIVSFDDISYSALNQIQLTTVSQHVEKMSSDAAKLMLQLLADPSQEAQRIILEPTLVVRNTTCPYHNK